ncbi:penicillin-binding protein 1A [Mobilisporobacter senegalensis]|uniref:Penicillin-binding protein 1A n=1 Tax=Mobilisporobacter senegalensis TaxID=1329262 RepID=A0A3N1XUR4_9FIRM|nr:PBP1A family penicillin-binding protein [Mobilisporobacter senegalensis]ROR30353.1 penicillin-binding protein 1A [Mobilisporobacter senegalensis]
MNFSKKGTVDKQKQIRSTSKKLVTKIGVSFFRTFLICLLVIAIVGSFAGYGILRGIIDSAPSIDSISVAPTGFSTTIYDQDGNELTKLVGSDANRIYAEIGQIPEHVQNAFIAIEDERFWKHNGIDVQGIVRVIFLGVSNGRFSQGASTLTQQLLKNQVFEGGNEDDFVEKFERKLQEQFLAIQLEEKLSKKQILEYYLNTINLGQNTLGVQAASNRYFDKDVSKLTISEAAVIAAITQNPAYNNPISYPENNSDRRIAILGNMKNQGYISQTEYDEAMEDNVYERIQTVNKELGESSVYSYFVDEMINQVVKDLQEKKGYTQAQANNAIYRGGLSIYTTQDSKLQNICDETLSNDDFYPDNSKWELNYQLSIEKKDGTTNNYSAGHIKNYVSKGNPNFSLLFADKKDADKYIEQFKASVIEDGDIITGENISFSIQPQISFVLMDQKNGQVKAIVGGRGEKKASRTLNRASSTVRQPGSTFKVISTFLPALDSAGMTLANVQDDAPYQYPNGTKVNNYYSGYKGLSTLRDAIVHSMNIVTVKTLEQVTPQIAYDYLLKLGFTTIVDSRTDESGRVLSDINLPMALGGLTDGITNLELTAAFAAIANNGAYIEPTFYTKIVDHDGKVLLENKPETRQVIKESTAWLLTSAMEDVVKRGTGTRLRLTNTSMPVAGKTGTTTNDNDSWFSGYTPYYTASIWSGYDNNGSLSNTSYTKDLWRTIMEKVNGDLKVKSFKMPNSVVSAKICTKSGKLAVDGVCDHAQGGSTVRTEYFAKGTAPKEKCDIHVKLSVCTESHKLATEYCPKSQVKDIVYLIKEETAKTADTPNLLPKGLEDSICNIHKSFIIDDHWGNDTDDDNNNDGTVTDPGDDGTIPDPSAGQTGNSNGNSNENSNGNSNDGNKKNNGLFNWFN